ncbi:unnamed protein product [Cutaneotrichosporon oleaginosum]
MHDTRPRLPSSPLPGALSRLEGASGALPHFGLSEARHSHILPAASAHRLNPPLAFFRSLTQPQYAPSAPPLHSKPLTVASATVRGRPSLPTPLHSRPPPTADMILAHASG